MRASPALLALVLLACKSSTKADAPTEAISAADSEGTLRVAAAADLAFAFPEVGAAFEKLTGHKVSFSFGSSGLLAKQIANGAPFDVYAAANVGFVDSVIQEGSCYADSKALYARGRIVLFTAHGDAPQTLASLVDPKYKTIAIANPAQAPYGRAAQQALTKAGVWETVKPKIVYGENIQQTMKYAVRGDAEVVIVAHSLALQTPGSFAPIEPENHDPIDQALVVCQGAARTAAESPNAAEGSLARRFATFVNSADGRAIMRKFGLLLPGESMAEKK